MSEPFEPKIVAFVCTYCTYAGADLAGTSRLKYPPNVRIVRLPCTGRMSPMFILKAFQKGADGVLVSGCHPGDCHFDHGNYHARRRWTAFNALLHFTGVPEERVKFSWISAAEGIKFAELIDSITEEIRQAGPFEQYHKLIAETGSVASV